MYNVVIQKQITAYNVDKNNRTAVCESDIENGCVFKLSKYSETDGEKKVWVAEQAAADDTGLWMAMSPEVINIADAMGTVYRGLAVDPRAFTNVAGAMIDAVLLERGDIIEMTGENIDNIDSLDYLVPSAADFKLEAAAAAGNGFCLQKVGTSILHIGSALIAKSHPTTYKFQVVKN